MRVSYKSSATQEAGRMKENLIRKQVGNNEFAQNLLNLPVFAANFKEIHSLHANLRVVSAWTVQISLGIRYCRALSKTYPLLGGRCLR